MGINNHELNQIKNYIENHKELLRSGKTIKDLPRNVTFLENGHVIVDTEPNKERTGTIKGHENDRRAWDATSGELCFVINKIAKEKFIKDENFIEMGSYQFRNDEFFVMEKKSPDISLTSNKETLPPQSIIVNFPKNKDDLYNKIGNISYQAELIKESIEKNYPKHINSEKVQSGGHKFIEGQLSVTDKWLEPISILKNGDVILELKDEGHLKGKNLIYELRSGKRYRKVEMNEEEWANFKPSEKDAPVFNFKTTDRNGKNVICVLFDEDLNKSVEEANSLGIKGWNTVSLPHEFIYKDQDIKSKKGPPYVIEFPTENAGWPSNKIGPNEKGPNKVWGLNANNKTTTRDEGEKTFSRATSELWKSDYLENVSGIEFTGSIQKNENGGHYKNHFAIFFHTDKFYDGGYEYGFAFRETTGSAQFYIEGEANINDLYEVEKNGQMVKEKVSNPNHIWKDWPKKDASGGGFTVMADEGFEEMLQDGKAFNIKIYILKNGDFHLQIKDPKTERTKKCTISKPDQFPNLHGANGYITINAQKFENDKPENPRVLDVQEIKTWTAEI